jgi:hypothetical protein
MNIIHNLKFLVIEIFVISLFTLMGYFTGDIGKGISFGLIQSLAFLVLFAIKNILAEQAGLSWSGNIK